MTNLLNAILLSVCLQAPMAGPVVQPFAPVGQFGGHWGIDLAATPGAVVRSPTEGTVTFAGTVAGMRSVTIDVGSGVLISTSYLQGIAVARGDLVRLGALLGHSGYAHGVAAVHLSVRVEGRYVDPAPYLACRRAGELHLLPPPQASTYPGQRAQRPARRNL